MRYQVSIADVCEAVDSGKVKFQPPRTELTGQQIERLMKLYPITGPLLEQNLHEWISGFMCDQSPEREIKVWEWLVAEYLNNVKCHWNHNKKLELLVSLIAESTKKCPITLERAP